MPKLHEQNEISKITALVMGKPRSGKSILAASFPGPIYLFDFDQKWRMLKGYYPDRRDIDFDVYSSITIPAFLTKLTELTQYCPYKTIIIDSLTSLGDSLIDYSIRERGNSKRSDDSKTEKKRGVIELSEIVEFAVEDRTLHKLWEWSKYVKAHVILNAHVIETERKDISGKVVGYNRSLVTGGKKVAAKLPAYFEEFWFVEKDPDVSNWEDDKYRVFFHLAGQDAAGTALPLPEKVDFSNKRFYDDVLVPLLSEKGITLNVQEDDESKKPEPKGEFEI